MPKALLSLPFFGGLWTEHDYVILPVFFFFCLWDTNVGMASSFWICLWLWHLWRTPGKETNLYTTWLSLGLLRNHLTPDPYPQGSKSLGIKERTLRSPLLICFWKSCFVSPAQKESLNVLPQRTPRGRLDQQPERAALLQIMKTDGRYCSSWNFYGTDVSPQESCMSPSRAPLLNEDL